MNVYIRFIGTYAEYDKIKDIQNIWALIKSEKEYTAIVERIEELLSNSENIDNPDAKGYVELNLLSDCVADYEESFHPIQPPSLAEAIKLRMQEWGLSQKSLSEYLGLSTSRISEHLNGKS